MIEAQHGAGVVVDDLFVVGVHQERHGSAGGSRSGFDHVGHVPLVVGLIEEIEFFARVRGVLGEVEVTTVRDPFELIPAPREQVFDIARTRAVVAQFVIVMGPQLDLRRIHAEVEIPVHTGLAPVLVPLLTFRRRDEELHLHLLELTSAEHEVARRDLVSERLPDLGDTERWALPTRVEHVGEVDEHALRRLGPKVNLRGGLGDRPGVGLEHQVELACLREGALAPAGRADVGIVELVEAMPSVAVRAVDQRIRKVGEMA